MIGFTYIRDLFKTVFAQSKVMQGRFFIATKGGAEINYDDLGQMLQEITELQDGPRFPLVLMLPPFLQDPETVVSASKYDRYRVVMFFLRTTHYNGNGSIIWENDLGTSDHGPVEDWDDMTREAKAFFKTLGAVESKAFISRGPVTPVTEVGSVRASGVRMDFGLSLASDCETLESYPANAVQKINQAQINSHSFHK